MGRADYLDLGNWNAVCDRCGNKFKASMLRKDWQGLYVCPRDYEPRQPQDFVKGVADIQSPPWTRPPPEEVFATFCTPNGRTGISDYATADCWIVEFRDPAFDPNATS